jgi:hypothetical protein
MGVLSSIVLGAISGFCVLCLSDHRSTHTVQSNSRSAKVTKLETNNPETETPKAETEDDKPDGNEKQAKQKHENIQEQRSLSSGAIDN